MLRERILDIAILSTTKILLKNPFNQVDKIQFSNHNLKNKIIIHFSLRKIQSLEMKFSFLGRESMFFQRDRYEFHEREYLFFSREACSGANDHQSAFRKLAALANSNLSTDTSAKCGMSWQSCRMSVSRVLHPDASSVKVLRNFLVRKHFVTPSYKGSHIRAWHM